MPYFLTLDDHDHSIGIFYQLVDIHRTTHQRRLLSGMRTNRNMKRIIPPVTGCYSMRARTGTNGVEFRIYIPSLL